MTDTDRPDQGFPGARTGRFEGDESNRGNAPRTDHERGHPGDCQRTQAPKSAAEERKQVLIVSNKPSFRDVAAKLLAAPISEPALISFDPYADKED